MRKRRFDNELLCSGQRSRIGRTFLLAVGLAGCASGGGLGVGGKGLATERSRVIEHEPCDLESKSADRVDVNGDGRPDLTIVMHGSVEVCHAADLDFDGHIDMWSYFDASSKLRRRELDYDRDGTVDEIQLFKAGVIAEKRRSSTPAKRIDTWEFYNGGRLARAERDADGDGRVDQWWDYRTPECPLIRTDSDGNGEPDAKSEVDYCKESGYKPPEQAAPMAAPMLQKETAPLPTETSSGGAETSDIPESPGVSRDAAASGRSGGETKAAPKGAASGAKATGKGATK
jgi:hypothetical protein